MKKSIILILLALVSCKKECSCGQVKSVTPFVGDGGTSTSLVEVTVEGQCGGVEKVVMTAATVGEIVCNYK